MRGHERLAVHLARRFTNRGVPDDDLEQVAFLALLGAIERFEPDRGVEFSSFATPTILGALKRHFRDVGWSVRVPRRLQELHLELNQHVTRLTQELGRAPSIAEVARSAHASTEEVLEALEAAQAYRAAPLTGGPDGAGPTDEVDPFSTVDDRDTVERLLCLLPAREQLIVRLRFHQEMTQAAIAERLGISQMHVSRLLRQSLAALRAAHDEAELPPDHPPA